MLSDKDYSILYKILWEYTLRADLTDELRQDLKNLQYNLDGESKKAVVETYHNVQSITALDFFKTSAPIIPSTDSVTFPFKTLLI